MCGRVVCARVGEISVCGRVVCISVLLVVPSNRLCLFSGFLRL